MLFRSHWNDAAESAFNQLKEAVSHPPVLALLDFTKPFIIECDASRVGLGAVLMQNTRPIAFHSQVLRGKSLHFSTYEKELLALATAVKKWRPYVLGSPFIVRTDHQSLKFLLEQRVGTPAQQKWITKLLGYVFIVEYKKGNENRVADALSRQMESELKTFTDQADLTHGTLSCCLLLSFPNPTWLDKLKDSYHQDAKVMQLI